MKNTLISLLIATASASALAVKVPFKNNDLMKKEVIGNYANMALLNYQDSLSGALDLQLQIRKFTKSAASNAQDAMKQFEMTKDAWAKNARMPYGQSEIFRFYNGPIDFEPVDDGVITHLEAIGFEGVEGLLNAWPLDEFYIDYVKEDADAGLINDRSIKLTADVITSMNEREGEKNISTGYHAIEFLLWGQDRSLETAGTRPYTDFVNGGTAKNQDRRREYLSLLADVLVDHLRSVTSQWDVKADNYRKEFLNRNTDNVLADIFTSMISMAGDELKSERIENAFLLEDQEEEHSCFSDMTINDIYTNALGVKNIYLGEYKAFNFDLSVEGKGIDTLVAYTNPELDKKIKAEFKTLFTAINFFYAKENGKAVIGNIAIPFDRAITENKDEVQAIIDSLGNLDELLREAAVELGLELDL
ncbi:imelysin family protein [Bacteriovorax sp. DB6_IX]|uniref:imelysin family protein n=1 Tax=Bacteriovorax sp. DB6_IX TaxID=1353530 RepID=UPI00038A370B|nr:imelysin family protein [Bacteriovorax sp. DB6_IX]EQC50622.1 imelysin [Bacteriovorax sp. DB6_IX]